ncbi:MAG: PolC-type DNA polymerase III [Candidatus Caccovivens sp.]
MNFEQEFRAKFGDKYDWLSLKDVVVKKEGICTITFLEPSTCQGVSESDKKEIIDWLKQTLQLEKMQLKVKFMKSFVEERLILKAIKTFFEKKYKIITSYLNDESFDVKITPIDVIVNIVLSERMINFFAEHKVSPELAKYLKSNFLVEFVINLTESEKVIDEVDIENVKMRTTLKPIKRYNVEIVKEVIGKGITPKPEYLSFIKSAKDSVIVAGFIQHLERRDFVAKSGKNVGQSRAYYSFVLEDEKGKIDCIHFCAKKNIAVMDALEDCMYVLLHGDVKLNKMGKLCLYVDKIALANKIEEIPTEVEPPKHDTNVVPIEKLLATEQDSMFEQSAKYNDSIIGKTIVVFDIETTGLDDENDQIIELGAVKVCDGNIIEKFSTFVKPTKKIPYEVVKLTGITQEMVEDAPPIEWVIQEFYEFTRGCTLCGHNIIGFDIKFVKREGQALGLDFDNPIIDTLNLARVARLKTTRFNLGTVTKLLGITLEGAHRAWNDAYATAQVLLKLSERK